MARITIGRVLSSSTDSVTVEPGATPLEVQEQTGLVPVEYDDIAMTYNTDNTIATAIYTLSTVTVATLAFGYTSGNLTSVTRT